MAKIRLPRLCWRQIANTNSGNERWETFDGMFRVVRITQCDGIPMRKVYVLWQWKHGTWHPVAEKRGRKAIDKIAAQRMAALESDD